MTVSPLCYSVSQNSWARLAWSHLPRVTDVETEGQGAMTGPRSQSKTAWLKMCPSDSQTGALPTGLARQVQAPGKSCCPAVGLELLWNRKPGETEQHLPSGPGKAMEG